MKREIGENPMRSRHCEKGMIFITTELEFGKEKSSMLLSQETCFYK